MGYRENDNKDEFDKQAKEIKANSIEIIEGIRKKCDTQHFMGYSEFTDIETNSVTQFQHYVLESGLHVYISGDNIIIANKEIERDIFTLYKDYETKIMYLQSCGVRLNDTRTSNGYVRLAYSGDLGDWQSEGPYDILHFTRSGTLAAIHTFGDHIVLGGEYNKILEPEDNEIKIPKPEDKNIFDLAEHGLEKMNSDSDKASNDDCYRNVIAPYEKRGFKIREEELKVFKEMVETEIRSKEQTVRNKETENENSETDNMKMSSAQEALINEILGRVKKLGLSQEEFRKSILEKMAAQQNGNNNQTIEGNQQE